VPNVEDSRVFGGKVALVTGAGQGIGRATALRLASLGADLVIADRDAAHAEAVTKEVVALGCRAVASAVDVATTEGIQALHDVAEREFGRIDILVNSAGLIRPNPFGRVTEDDWDRTFAVNARGLFFTMQAIAPLIPDGGVIVNIGSTAGRGTPTGSPPYAASKAAVINVTQTTARSLAARRIRVNAVCPGAVDTAFQSGLALEQGLDSRETIRRWEASNPMGRAAQPEEIAAAIAYLASPAAELITGQTLNIDGGSVIY
jgi:NAD(P)-dependent dehydrogenase (short-subunit alcohol dehydrogenase family)